MENFYPELLQRYLDRQTNEDESRIVVQWLEKNNLSKEDISYVLEHPERIWIYKDIDPQENWPEVRRKISAKRNSMAVRTLLKAAASMLVILAVSGVGYQVYQFLNRPVIVANNSNKVMEVMLPDSSCISLDKHATLTYYKTFSHKRTINFEGQAFFQIKRNIQKPFVIKTSQSNVKVLGTSFCVLTNDSATDVTVVSGKVALYSSHELSDTLYLEKGDKGSYYSQNAKLEKQKNKDLNFMAWKDRRLVFNKTPMTVVIQDLEKFFGIKVKVKSPEIYKLTYTSEFKNPTLQEVITEMEFVLNIQSVVSGNQLLMTLK